MHCYSGARARFNSLSDKAIHACLARAPPSLSMNTGEFPRAMAEIARHRSLTDLCEAIVQALVPCGVENAQVWLGGDGEGTFVQQEGHGCILTVPLSAHGDLTDALVVRVGEPLAGFQHEHLRTFADHAAALIANARALEQALAGQRDAEAALAEHRRIERDHRDTLAQKVAGAMAQLESASDALSAARISDADHLVTRVRKTLDEAHQSLRTWPGVHGGGPPVEAAEHLRVQ